MSYKGHSEWCRADHYYYDSPLCSICDTKQDACDVCASRIRNDYAQAKDDFIPGSNLPNDDFIEMPSGKNCDICIISSTRFLGYAVEKSSSSTIGCDCDPDDDETIMYIHSNYLTYGDCFAGDEMQTYHFRDPFVVVWSGMPNGKYVDEGCFFCHRIDIVKYYELGSKIICEKCLTPATSVIFPAGVSLFTILQHLAGSSNQNPTKAKYLLGSIHRCLVACLSNCYIRNRSDKACGCCARYLTWSFKEYVDITTLGVIHEPETVSITAFKRSQLSLLTYLKDFEAVFFDFGNLLIEYDGMNVPIAHFERESFDRSNSWDLILESLQIDLSEYTLNNTNHDTKCEILVEFDQQPLAAGLFLVQKEMRRKNPIWQKELKQRLDLGEFEQSVCSATSQKSFSIENDVSLPLLNSFLSEEAIEYLSQLDSLEWATSLRCRDTGLLHEIPDMTVPEEEVAIATPNLCCNRRISPAGLLLCEQDLAECEDLISYPDKHTRYGERFTTYIKNNCQSESFEKEVHLTRFCFYALKIESALRYTWIHLMNILPDLSFDSLRKVHLENMVFNEETRICCEDYFLLWTDFAAEGKYALFEIDDTDEKEASNCEESFDVLCAWRPIEDLDTESSQATNVQHEQDFIQEIKDEQHKNIHFV